MVAIRLRHPRGVTTLDIDPEAQTVRDLQVLIFSATEIPPTEQELKYGYPPKALPDTGRPLSSVPIGRGEQIIVTALPAGTAALVNASSSPSNPSRTSGTVENTSSALPPPPAAPSVKVLNEALSAPTPIHHEDEPVDLAESVALPGRDAGFLQLRVVPDDNSCLFSALGVVFEGGIAGGRTLREVVANEIRRDPETWSDVVLGQPRDSYISKIASPDTWGGAIELSIFAKHYKTEISSFDVATGRCDRFGEGEYSSRCVLVYSGIHYDAVTLSPLLAAPPSFHTTVFPTSDQTILSAASQLVAQLKERHYYTDTSSFDLRCGICGAGLKGEKGAREHAMQTGHVQFGEYRT